MLKTLCSQAMSGHTPRHNKKAESMPRPMGKEGECRALPLRTLGIGGESHYGGHLNDRCLAQACRCADDPSVGKRGSFRGSGPLRMRDNHRGLAASVPYHDDVG